MSGPIEAGERTIKVTDPGAELHEAIVVRPGDGATAEDFAIALESGKAPPGGFIGGAQAMHAGQEALFRAAFDPGSYAVICFVPDSQAGKAHYELGMVTQVTVQ